jgi:hypothetical protein
VSVEGVLDAVECGEGLRRISCWWVGCTHQLSDVVVESQAQRRDQICRTSHARNRTLSFANFSSFTSRSLSLSLPAKMMGCEVFSTQHKVLSHTAQVISKIAGASSLILEENGDSQEHHLIQTIPEEAQRLLLNCYLLIELALLVQCSEITETCPLSHHVETSIFSDSRNQSRITPEVLSNVAYGVLTVLNIKTNALKCSIAGIFLTKGITQHFPRYIHYCTTADSAGGSSRCC